MLSGRGSGWRTGVEAKRFVVSKDETMGETKYPSKLLDFQPSTQVVQGQHLSRERGVSKSGHSSSNIFFCTQLR